jgi:hypothetical protein
MFPLTLSGRIRIKSRGTLSPQTVQDEIASTLLVSGVMVDYLPDGGFLFRLGMLQHFSRTFLLGISSGTVRCSEQSGRLRIGYRLRFFHLMLQVSALLFICWRVEVAFSPIPIPRDYYLVVWIWLVFGNILVTLQRFRRFLRGCVSDSTERIFFWRNVTGSEGEAPGGNSRPAPAAAGMLILTFSPDSASSGCTPPSTRPWSAWGGP